VWTYNSENAAESVQRLNHGRNQSCVTAVARKNLADRGLQPADQLFCFLPFLIGHVGSLSLGAVSPPRGKNIPQKRGNRLDLPIGARGKKDL
jgi:hypothetical protein